MSEEQQWAVAISCEEEVRSQLLSSRVERSYDARGNVLVVHATAASRRGDELSSTMTYRYDDETGALVSIETAMREGEEAPAMGTTSLTYDAEGRLIQRITDSDGDGSEEERIDWTFDSDGRLEGTVRGGSRWTYAYDVMGHLTEATVEREGERSGHHLYEYDRRGRWIGTQVSRLDGTEVVVCEYGDDETRAVIRSIRTDGVERRRTLTDFDRTGRLLSSKCEGVGCRSVIESRYDAASGFMLLERRANEPTETDTLTRDERGHVTRYERDRDSDGTADQVRNYTYDERDNLLSFASPTESATWGFDCLEAVFEDAPDVVSVASLSDAP